MWHSAACTLQNTLHLILCDVVRLCGLHCNKNVQTIITQTKPAMIYPFVDPPPSPFTDSTVFPW